MEEGLKDWFINHKMPRQVQANPLAVRAWERALEDLTPSKIRTYYVMAGMDMYIKDFYE